MKYRTMHTTDGRSFVQRIAETPKEMVEAEKRLKKAGGYYDGFSSAQIPDGRDPKKRATTK